MSSVDGNSIRRRARDHLIEDVREQISRGSLQAGHLLPSVSELADKYGVSSRAVREGLAHLEAQGLVQGGQGRRTLVVGKTPVVKSEIRSQKNVAVIFQGRVRDNSTAEELDGLQQAFQAEGYGTILYVADGSPEKEAEIVRRLAKEGVPGLVLYSAHSINSVDHLQEAHQSGMKVVVFDHDFPSLDINFVGIDDQLAGREATDHLLRLGCRELLMINSDRDWTTAVLRQKGFEEAAAAWDGEVKTSVIQLPAFQTLADYDEALKQTILPRLDQFKRPLGVFVWWDEIALRTIELLKTAGWSVPGDAKVVGVGNDLSGELAETRLTTMAVPRPEITRAAATALVNQMRDPRRHGERVRLKARMLIRESCGTYPALNRTKNRPVVGVSELTTG